MSLDKSSECITYQEYVAELTEAKRQTKIALAMYLDDDIKFEEFKLSLDRYNKIQSKITGFVEVYDVI